MTKQETALFREFAAKHPSFSQEQETVDEIIAFFYDQIRDDNPALLAKIDRALRERYAGWIAQ